MKKLNLGCGPNTLEGYINHDIIKFNPKVDIVFDLENTPYPFKDNELDEIYSHGVFVYIKNFKAMMKECHRILKPNGKLIIEVPYVRNTGAFANPLHINYFNELTFHVFTTEGGDGNLELIRRYSS